MPTPHLLSTLKVWARLKASHYETQEKHGVKVPKPNIIISGMVFLLFFLPFSFDSFAQSRSQNYKIFTDVLDEFGGGTQSANYLLRISSGGQPGVVGVSEASSFHAQQGYVHTVTFLHGDANNDGRVSIGDVIFMINCLFRGGDCPEPPEVGDVNCDSRVSIGDVIYLVNYLFRGGPAPCI